MRKKVALAIKREAIQAAAEDCSLALNPHESGPKARKWRQAWRRAKGVRTEGVRFFIPWDKILKLGRFQRPKAGWGTRELARRVPLSVRTEQRRRGAAA